MVEVLAAVGVEVAETHWLSWLIGGGIGSVTIPVLVWRFWSWLRKRASLSATIRIGEDQETEMDHPVTSDPFSQSDCNEKHATIERQLIEIQLESRTMHVAIDDGFSRIADRLDTVNTRMDEVYRHLLENRTHPE